jgi:PPOX class probable F420-dependent enzyme
MAPRKPAPLDSTSTRGKHIQARLKKELIIWLATVGRDGHPHVVPVWFWWDGSSFLVYSIPGQKVRDIEVNPNVALHLNTDAEAEDVVRVDCTAELPKRQAPAYKVPEYISKYARLIKGYGWTPEGFSADYKVPLRILPTRFHLSG